MSDEEQKHLEVVVEEATLLSSDRWLISITLDGDCLDSIECFEIFDDDHKIEKKSSDKTTRFYIDFETDTIDDHMINCRIKMTNEPLVSKTIELIKESQTVKVIPEELISALQKTQEPKTKDDQTNNGNSKITPFKFLQEAIKAVPAVKWALGIGGIISVIAIVSGFGIDLRVAVFGTIITIPLMMLLVIFARATETTNKTFQPIVIIFTYFILFLFMFVSLALVFSVLFRYPIDLQYWLTK